MKKVLILGGAGVHCKLVEAAHEMNLCGAGERNRKILERA